MPVTGIGSADQKYRTWRVCHAADTHLLADALRLLPMQSGELSSPLYAPLYFSKPDS